MLWKSSISVAVFELVAGVLAFKAYEDNLFTGTVGDYIICVLLWIVAANGLANLFKLK